MVTIRKATENDRSAILEGFNALQAYERSIEANRADPADIADTYLRELFAECRDGKAEILVAEVDMGVVGWVGVVPRHISDDILDHDREFAYISDLIVLEDYRGRGIGRRLLAAAEEYVATKGVRRLRVGVLAANAAAHRLYHAVGFRDYEVILEKQILILADGLKNDWTLD
jgi:ribosomal protein S18 acetylase RimI-like enzyme